MAKQYHGKTLVPECVWRLRPTMSPISSLSKQHWTATRLWNHYWYLAYSPITNTIRTLVFPVASPEKKLFEVFILHEEWQCSTVSTKYKSDRIVFKSQCTPAVQAIDCALKVKVLMSSSQSWWKDWMRLYAESAWYTAVAHWKSNDYHF